MNLQMCQSLWGFYFRLLGYMFTPYPSLDEGVIASDIYTKTMQWSYTDFLKKAFYLIRDHNTCKRLSVTRFPLYVFRIRFINIHLFVYFISLFNFFYVFVHTTLQFLPVFKRSNIRLF